MRVRLQDWAWGLSFGTAVNTLESVTWEDWKDVLACLEPLLWVIAYIMQVDADVSVGVCADKDCLVVDFQIQGLDM